MATGRNPRLQHQSRERLEFQRTAVDCGVPTGNVGYAQSEHLGGGRIGDHGPRCRIGVVDRDGLSRGVVRREGPTGLRRHQRRCGGTGYSIEPLTADCLDEMTASWSSGFLWLKDVSDAKASRGRDAAHRRAELIEVGATSVRTCEAVPDRVVRVGSQRIVHGQFVDLEEHVCLRQDRFSGGTEVCRRNTRLCAQPDQ